LDSSRIKKTCGGIHRRRQKSLLAEGLAVSTLVHSGVLLMGTHQDSVQRAVVGVIAVISAGLDGALNALIGVFVHFTYLLFLRSQLVYTPKTG
jgi:hypothetical protein